MAHIAEAPGDRIGGSAESSRRRLLVDGVIWTVRLYVSGYDRRQTTDLLFESEGIVRRIRDYPPDWFTLSAVNLFALSYGR